jgi:hypothetical protein
MRRASLSDSPNRRYTPATSGPRHRRCVREIAHPPAGTKDAQSARRSNCRAMRRGPTPATVMYVPPSGASAKLIVIPLTPWSIATGSQTSSQGGAPDRCELAASLDDLILALRFKLVPESAHRSIQAREHGSEHHGAWLRRPNLRGERCYGTTITQQVAVTHRPRKARSLRPHSRRPLGGLDIEV